MPAIVYYTLDRKRTAPMINCAVCAQCTWRDGAKSDFCAFGGPYVGWDETRLELVVEPASASDNAVSEAERAARENHRRRQREGHHTPDWEGLSDLMRAELIHREQQKAVQDRSQTASANPTDT